MEKQEKLRQLEPGAARGSLDNKMWLDTMWLAEEKLDGVRYLMHLGFKDKKPYHQFTSRRISDVTGQYVEKTDNFPHLNSVRLDKVWSGTILDGEITAPNGNGSNVYNVITVTGAKADKAVAAQKAFGYLQYIVFDILFFKGKDVRKLQLRKRYVLRDKVLQELSNQYIVGIKSQTIHKYKAYQKLLVKGKEGIILKYKDSLYGEDWVKVKRVTTYDVVVIGYELPQKYTTKVTGKTTLSKFHKRNWIGAIRFGQYEEGELIQKGTCSGMDDSIREQVSKNKKKYLGKVMEIKAQEITHLGHYRHPRFLRWRSDKGAKQCIYKSKKSSK